MGVKRDKAVETLDHYLKERAVPADARLQQALDRERVRCVACGHRCRIPNGRDGICRVRFNRNGRLYSPDGYVAGLQVDPIEKKPFFHAFPGKDALSFGLPGCNLHCAFCQNWISSQALRENRALASTQDVTAEQLVALAVRHGVPAAVSTYNEPLISAEWSAKIFSLAKQQGVTCGYVSNGYATPEVLRFLRPVVDLYKVDLKCYSNETYRKLGGKLDVVTESIKMIHELGFWMEVVTLLVPGMNDSESELQDLAGFLASVSTQIPWHITAFHPDFRETGRRATTVDDLRRGVEAGRSAGLQYVYAGNLPGRVDRLENTCCHACGRTVIKRLGFRVLSNYLAAGGRCPSCKTALPGFWSKEEHTPASRD